MRRAIILRSKTPSAQFQPESGSRTALFIRGSLDILRERPLGFGSAELAAEKPFYHRLDGGPALRHSFIPGRAAEDTARALARDRARLEADDPLRLVAARLAAAPAALPPPRKRRWGGDDSPAPAREPPSPLPDAARVLPGGKTFAQLREERLLRDVQESRRAAVIMGRR